MPDAVAPQPLEVAILSNVYTFRHAILSPLEALPSPNTSPSPILKMPLADCVTPLPPDDFRQLCNCGRYSLVRERLGLK